MRKTALVIAVLAVNTAPAHARTVLDGDSPAAALYQQWIDQSLVPTASVHVSYQSRSCTEWDADACIHTNRRGYATALVMPDYAYLENPLYSENDRISTRLQLLHETGHVYDYSLARKWYRQRFSRIMRYRPGGDWVDSTLPDGTPVYPDEQFAMAFAYCSMYRERPDYVIKNVYWGYDFYPSRRQYRRLCSLLRSLPAYY